MTSRDMGYVRISALGTSYWREQKCGDASGVGVSTTPDVQKGEWGFCGGLGESG